MFGWRKRIESKIDRLLSGEGKEMSAISDLQAAETGIASAVAAAVTLIQNFQNGTVNADDPQVEAVVTQLNTAAATLNAAVQPAPAASATAAPAKS
jgi:hypothetical protein